MSHRSGASAPVRTCVGCRARESSSVLLRIVARQGEDDGNAMSSPCVLVPDPEARLRGRGAWIHASRHCLRSAERRRAFGRALRVRGNPGAGKLVEYIAAIDAAAIDPAERDRGGR